MYKVVGQMIKSKHIKLFTIALVTLSLASCNVSKSSAGKSLADKIEKAHKKKPNKPNSSKPKSTNKPKQGKLADYCEAWLGTPYRAGGETKQGVDCSGFVSNVYKDVYGIKLPRRSQDMEKACKTTKSLSNLKEGDLVFFNNKAGGQTNHVGIFLDSQRFIHASTSKGVTISQFNEKYWSERFRCGGIHPGRR